jgi:hypothetical protein
MNRTWGMLKWLVVGASALALSACAGFVPPTGLSVQDVEINASASEVEFVGGVEAMGAASWTVGGVPVGISAETQVDPGLAVGDLAKVHAMVAADSSLTAREIRAVESQASSSSLDGSSSADNSQPEMEFTGAVVSIDPTAWVVGDRTLAVTTATEIKDAIVVGDMVKVHALPQPDGSLTAREIELAASETSTGSGEDEVPPGDVDFFGLVEDIQADHWLVAGTTFLVTTDTEIKDAIVIGDSVKVEATPQADGTYLAHEIELEDSSSSGQNGQTQNTHTDFFGQVTAMNSGSWTVGGLTFLVTPSTEIKDAIAVGDFVKIEASVGADGSLTALEIELEEDQIGDDDDDGEDDSDDEQEDEQEDESGEDESGDDDSENSGSGGSGGDD